jgi:putative tricarboxylic transport membrane protein
MNKDILGGIILLVVAGAYYGATLQIPESSLSDEVGAQGLPTILAFLLAGLAVLIIVRGVVMARRQLAAAAVAEDAGEAPPRRALGLLAIAAGYIAVAPLVGFAPALALLIAAVAIYEGMAASWRLIMVAASGALAFWLLFVQLLGVEQPAGLLF